MEEESYKDGFYINDFHRRNSMAAQREAQRMSLQPYSREQKLEQISTLHQGSASKQRRNTQRFKKEE